VRGLPLSAFDDNFAEFSADSVTQEHGETVVYIPKVPFLDGNLKLPFTMPFAETSHEAYFRKGSAQKQPRTGLLEFPSGLADTQNNPITYDLNGQYQILGVTWRCDGLGPPTGTSFTTLKLRTGGDNHLDHITKSA
jgi:hypothetical protein